VCYDINLCRVNSSMSLGQLEQGEFLHKRHTSSVVNILLCNFTKFFRIVSEILSDEMLTSGSWSQWHVIV